MKRFVVVGGGAAGFFAAINAAEQHKNLEVIILEGSPNVLQKVKVSGGGRCNVTNACFVPNELVTFYPRGNKELLGPFHQFMTGDTMEWFENRGVPLKIEADNRVFPQSNSSQSIIDCFLGKANQLGIELNTSTRVDAIKKHNEKYVIVANNNEILADYVLVATGSNNKVWEMLKKLNHTIIEPVPSLFTFNIPQKNLNNIPGVSVSNAQVSIVDTNLSEQGPLLITHWGLSGPAILKLSARGARTLFEKNYQFEININWINLSCNQVFEMLIEMKKQNPKKTIFGKSFFAEIPKRLWEVLLNNIHLSANLQWAQLNNKQLDKLAKKITSTKLQVTGKSTFKDEFVTAGGVDLKEINFKKFESKLHKNLFFAGEVLNIDAVTGGFNFQNAWTGGWIVAQSLEE